ncbi:MAG: hypothetical protein J0I48_08420, partial [Devosia sp.]|nr:hypothetical protein [Devosia sp.]
KMPASDNAQQCHVDHSTAPAQTTRGKGHTWVKSRWKNPSLLGQFSVAINKPWEISLVKRLYPRIAALRAALPHRTASAIEGMCHRLGLPALHAPLRPGRDNGPVFLSLFSSHSREAMIDFFPNERVVLSIDGANLYASCRALGVDLDFKLLLDRFSA